MKLLITGAKGFIGKNLISELKNIKETSADIFVIVNKKNSSEKAILKLSMKKVNNKWYLNDFVY